MKRLLAVLLVVLMAAALSGCCLRHDMQPATCTQPSTCSKCGKTEGEPLGHTPVDDPAREPTCTEAGLTAGSHCSTCGEVFTAQEEIPALGHDWEEATFSKPQVCKRCGEVGEDALGSEFFVRALTAEPELEEAAAEKAEEEWKPVLKTISIIGRSNGFDEMDELLKNSGINLTIDMPEKNSLAMLGEAIIQGSDPIRLILTGDEEGLSFTLPGISEEIYRVSYDDLKAALEASGSDTSGINAMQSSLGGVTSEEQQAAKEFLLRYAEIYYSVFNQENTTETEGAYAMSLINATQECTVLTSKPSAEDWEKMLTELLQTALSDEELDMHIGMAAERSFSGNAYGEDADLEEYKASVIEGAHESIQDALDNVAELAANLAQYEFETAYADNRLYAVKVKADGESLVIYESDGERQSGRTDKVQFPIDGQPVILTSTVREENEKIVGRVSVDVLGINLDYTIEPDENDTKSFDFNLTGMGMTLRLTQKQEDGTGHLKLSFSSFYMGSAELDVFIEDSDEHVTLPEGETIVLTTEEEIEQAIEKIGEDFQNANLFGAA